MNDSLMTVNKLKQWEIEKIQKIKSISVNLSINEKKKCIFTLMLLKKNLRVIYRFSQG